jgi:Fe2+ transport system protein FeoA
MLGIETESWKGLKRWVSDHWDEVINAVKRRLEGVEADTGFELAGALEELERLKSRLDDDKVAREDMAPALLLIQAERLGVNEATLRYFGAVISGAIDGDGYVSAARKEVDLISGEREVALLWAAALAAYGIKAEVRRAGGAFNVVASGDDAVRLARLYFLYGPPLLEGDDRVKIHKLAEAVELGAEGLDIRWEGLRKTEGGLVAADLIISVEGDAVKYNVYLRNAIELEFHSTNRSRAELAARLLRLAGVSAEVKKVRVGGRDTWRVIATTDKLAAGREELRKTFAEMVREAVKNGWVDEKKAEGWLEKLERGLVLMEGWPKYKVELARSGALVVIYRSTDRNSIQQVAQRLENMGLVKGAHFTVKMPEGGKEGYVNILREGIAHAAWLSVYGKDEKQRRLAAEFVELILQRAKDACGGAEQCAVYEKASKIIEEGRAWRSQTLKGFEKKVEVDGKTYFVKVTGGEAVEENQNGKTLLRIKTTAEVGLVEGGSIVDRVEREYMITYSRHRKTNAALGRAYASAEAPGGRKADAERYSALIKALTGKEPRVYQRSDGKIEIMCYEGHLEGFMRYVELADDIEKWLEETSRRAGSSTSQL